MSMQRTGEEVKIRKTRSWPREGYISFQADDGRTHQNFAKECDINTILAKYKKTGLIDHVARHNGQYGDFTDPVDFETAMNLVVNAQEMFMELPADVRSQFGNDPGAFLNYATNPENASGMRDLGLLPPEEFQAAQPESKAGERSESQAASAADENGSISPDATPENKAPTPSV